MLAPIDSKVTFEVEGVTITLRLNFRTLALAKKAGVNLLSGAEMDPVDLAVAVKAMASADHPELTEDQAFAAVVRGGEATAKALAELFADFGGSAEGKAKRAAKPAA